MFTEIIHWSGSRPLVSDRPSSLGPHWNSSWIFHCCPESWRFCGYPSAVSVLWALQQVKDGAVVRLGQPKAQDVSLGSSWAGWSWVLGLTPLGKEHPVSSARPMPSLPVLPFLWWRAGPSLPIAGLNSFIVGVGKGQLSYFNVQPGKGTGILGPVREATLLFSVFFVLGFVIFTLIKSSLALFEIGL